MTASAFSAHGTLSDNLVLSLRWGHTFIRELPLRSPMSIFLSHKGDLKNARREPRNE